MIGIVSLIPSDLHWSLDGCGTTVPIPRRSQVGGTIDQILLHIIQMIA